MGEQYRSVMFQKALATSQRRVYFCIGKNRIKNLVDAAPCVFHLLASFTFFIVRKRRRKLSSSSSVPSRSVINRSVLSSRVLFRSSCSSSSGVRDEKRVFFRYFIFCYSSYKIPSRAVKKKKWVEDRRRDFTAYLALRKTI